MSIHDDDDQQQKPATVPGLGLGALLRSLTTPHQSTEVKVAEDRSDAGAGIIHPTGADDDKPSDRRPTATPTNYDPNPSGRPDDPVSVKVPAIVRVKAEGHVPTREVPPDTWTLQTLTITADRVVCVAPANVDRVSVELINIDGAGGVIFVGNDPDVLGASSPPAAFLPLTNGSPLRFGHTESIYAVALSGTPAVCISTELRQSERT